MSLKWNVSKLEPKLFPLRKWVVSASEGSVKGEKRFFGVLFPKLMWKRLARKIHRKMKVLEVEMKAARIALQKAPK